MTNPLEKTPQQIEFLPPVDQELLNTEASLVLRDYFQPDVDGIAEEIRQTPEPSLGYWEPCVRGYASSDRAPNLDRFEYEDEAREKAPEERNAFDKFVLGVSAYPPEDVRAPEGSHLTPYGYYKDTGKRLLTAVEEGRVPEGFEDPALLEKATDFLLARGVNQLFAQPSRANVDLDTALTLYRQATEHIPGFDPQNAGSNLLIRTGIACRAILKAESPHFAQTRSAGREQAAQILQIASEAQAIDHIHSDTTLTKMYERQAALDQELGLHEPLDQKTQHDAESKEPTEAWPTEESESSGPLPEVVTSLKSTEQAPDNDSTDTPPRGVPILHPPDTSTEEATRQARHNVDASFDGDRQMVFTDTAGVEWERQPHNTVVNPNGPEPVWRTHTQSADSGEAEHVLVPADIRVEQQPSTGWPDNLEHEPQIGGSRVDQFFTRLGRGLQRWSRANATHDPDARLKNRVGNAFGALGGLVNGKSGQSSTAAEMDARDAEEYAHVDAAVAEGHTVSYDANGNAVVNAEPTQSRPSRREHRRMRQDARSAEGQSAPQPEQRRQPQTAGEARLEQLRHWKADMDARLNSLNDHLLHNEQSLAAQDIRNMPASGLQLPAETINKLSGEARQLWEVRTITEAQGNFPLPPPDLIRTGPGRIAYEHRLAARRNMLPWVGQPVEQAPDGQQQEDYREVFRSFREKIEAGDHEAVLRDMQNMDPWDVAGLPRTTVDQLQPEAREVWENKYITVTVDTRNGASIPNVAVLTTPSAQRRFDELFPYYSSPKGKGWRSK